MNIKDEKLEVEFLSSGIDRPLQDDLITGLYRIAQELLNNAIKHARADKITLQLIGHASSIILIIEDNGKGFDKRKIVRGLGFNSILARVKALEGLSHIDSWKNKGTTVTIEVPVPLGS